MTPPGGESCVANCSSCSTIWGRRPREATLRNDDARLAARAFSSGWREAATNSGQSRLAFLERRPPGLKRRLASSASELTRKSLAFGLTQDWPASNCETSSAKADLPEP